MLGSHLAYSTLVLQNTGKLEISSHFLFMRKDSFDIYDDFTSSQCLLHKQNLIRI